MPSEDKVFQHHANAISILAKLGDIQVDLGKNTVKTEAIEQHLLTLNGTVAKHEGDLNAAKITESQVLGQLAILLSDLNNRKDNKKELNALWIERMVWVGGVLLYAVLTKLHIISL